MALKTRPNRVKSASRRGSLGALLGALGPFWSAQGPPGGNRACLGPFLEGFGMDLEVRAAKEEGIHSEPS